jgi:hypothetical protein
MTNLTQIKAEQSFEELTRLTNSDLKWGVWWGCYSVISKTTEMEQEGLPRVQDGIIYFADGKNSIHFETNDEALFEATRIINRFTLGLL